MARVFVTGGSGRVGQPLIRHLVDQDHTVVALARSDAAAAAVRAAGAHDVVRGDVLDADSMAPGVRGADWVLHLAGGVRGPGRTTPDVLNRQGTEALLAACAGQPIAKLVLASSGAVYGDRSNLWIEEDFEPSPNTRYGRSKADAEQLALASGLPVVVARIAAVYGRDFPFGMVERMAQDKAWLPGEGRNHVPTVHIDDCVRALVHLAQVAPAGTIAHVADRTQPTLGDFYAAVNAAAGGTPVRFWSTYVPSYVQTWAAQQNERLQSRMGTTPRVTPDTLKLFTNSVRLRTEVLADLGFSWVYGDYGEGVRQAYGGP
jgi:nucleoside-diphosphate-sugar epimerase